MIFDTEHLSIHLIWPIVYNGLLHRLDFPIFRLKYTSLKNKPCPVSHWYYDWVLTIGCLSIYRKATGEHRDDQGRLIHVGPDSGLYDGHAVCNRCHKDMPVCWDTVCWTCRGTFCYDCSEIVSIGGVDKWNCKTCASREKKRRAVALVVQRIVGWTGVVCLATLFICLLIVRPGPEKWPAITLAVIVWFLMTRALPS